MITVPLDPGFHDRSEFDAGEPSITNYLQKQARQWSDKGLAACYVYTNERAAIIGYYTLSASTVTYSEFPVEQQKKLPSAMAVPAVLLGRLGVDRSYQHQGIGSMLVVDALRRAFESDIAWNVFIVDALSTSARRWYESLGFVLICENPVRLGISRQTVAKLLA